MILILDREIPRPQPAEIAPPPGYTFSEKGEQVRHDEYGKWRVLDVEDQHVITLNAMVIMDRALNRARVIADKVAVPAKYL